MTHLSRLRISFILKKSQLISIGCAEPVFTSSDYRHSHLAADVGRKQPLDCAVFAKRMGDYALTALFKAQLRRLG